ncbi:hypothetical protein [Pseudoduganella lutea]|uniref:Uncharacterized protein n=1 Tax=Pseudoduganella lutea TaxID=321985 RepID=A0A4P6L3V9_9BURK|nr:hypothetical protein [Pseudoduganella lutea]QBE66346.1 hypothetical protein EWM63_28015 [Pseudoduganella lutea]
MKAVSILIGATIGATLFAGIGFVAGAVIAGPRGWFTPMVRVVVENRSDQDVTNIVLTHRSDRQLSTVLLSSLKNRQPSESKTGSTPEAKEDPVLNPRKRGEM